MIRGLLGDAWNILPSPVDSIREATFTVSPKRQYLGIACPTTPVYRRKTRRCTTRWPLRHGTFPGN